MEPGMKRAVYVTASTMARQALVLLQDNVKAHFSSPAVGHRTLGVLVIGMYTRANFGLLWPCL